MDSTFLLYEPAERTHTSPRRVVHRHLYVLHIYMKYSLNPGSAVDAAFLNTYKSRLDF